MKLQQARNIVFVKRREAPWDAPILAKLAGLSSCSFFSRLAGLHDDPRALLRCEVSAFSKVYATLLNVLSLASTVQAILHAVNPSLVQEEYAVVTLTKIRDMSIFIRPIYSAAMTAIRIVLAVGLHRKSNLFCMRRIIRDISNDPYLGDHRVDMKKIRFIFTVVTVSYILWTVIAGIAFAVASPSLARKPLFYVLLFEIYLYVSAISICGCNLAVVSLFVLLPLLKIVADVFEEAVRSADAYTMRCAIACHEICRRLIEVIDGIGSYFFGISVLTGVPLIAIAASTVNQFREEQAGYGFWATMVFALIYFLFITFFILLASAVHREAQKPQIILTDHIIVKEELLQLSAQFLARFQVRALGYTFFHIVTIKGETILSFFSLITTYVIIAFQLKAG